MSLADRFWSKVEHRGASDCWEWTAGTLSKGRYGGFYDGKMRHAHRVAYELCVGEIPDGLVIDHLCGNTLCVNPAHLEAVTQRENILRGESFAASHARTTHCPSGHAYDEANTRVYKGMRVCRECNRLAKQRERRAS
jgi:hypothetical protein